jgi:hypothetical protein
MTQITRKQAELLLDYIDARLRLHTGTWQGPDGRKEANDVRLRGDQLRGELLDAFGPPPDPPAAEEPTRNWRVRFQEEAKSVQVPGRVLSQMRDLMSGGLDVVYHGVKMEGAEEA